MKKLSECQKVKLLEKTTESGSIEELKEVLDRYQPFECMANALGIAVEKRGVAFVELLVNCGATFWYPYDGVWNRKYGLYWKGGKSSGFHFTRRYLMRESTLTLDEKLAVVRFLMEHPELKASADEILYEALMRCDLEFADGLMEMGVNLDQTPPGYFFYNSRGYFSGQSNNAGTYQMILTSGSTNIYWMEYVDDLSGLYAEELLPVLSRLHKLTEASGKKLALTASAFERLHWDSAALAFAVEHMDLSRVEKNKEKRQLALQKAILLECVPALSHMVEQGWHKKPEQLLEWIQFATDHQKPETTAWLIEYRNRTVDVAAEAIKAEKKQMRELMEDPNSVSALKKIWSYQKLEDGTLMITGYKGQDTEVVVPARIGKNLVSAIGERAFSPGQSRIKNRDVRNKLTEVVLPEGITAIGRLAFYNCDNLCDIWLPDVKNLGHNALWTGGWKKLVLHTTKGSDLAKREKSAYKTSVVSDYGKKKK